MLYPLSYGPKPGRIRTGDTVVPSAFAALPTDNRQRNSMRGARIRTARLSPSYQMDSHRHLPILRFLHRIRLRTRHVDSV